MAFLQYYARENARHADTRNLKVDFAAAMEMTKALCQHFKVPVIPTKLFVKGGAGFKRMRQVKSWYAPAKGEIVYHPAMLNPLTVAHEVAHYVDHMRCRAAKRSQGRVHCVRHRLITDTAVNFLKMSFKGLFTNPMKQDAMALKSLMTHGVDFMQSADQLIANFYQGLPEKLTCPCCSAHLPKMNFGVRVMKKDALGLPLIIRRQSYCKACR